LSLEWLREGGQEGGRVRVAAQEGQDLIDRLVMEELQFTSLLRGQ
jgi:hypothetical protein